MPLTAQEIGRSKPAGAAADHGDALTRVGFDKRNKRRATCHIHIGGEGFEGRDGDRLIHKAAAALLFTGVRANAPDGRGQRDLFFDKARRLGVFAVGNEPHIPLAVRARRARLGAGRFAVAVVVGQKQLQRHFACAHNALGVGMHDHAVAYFGRAGALQFGRTLHLDNAQPACAVQFHPAVKAEVRYFQSVCRGGGEQRCARLHLQRLVIYGNLNQTHAFTSTAPKLQFSTHLPHLIHSAASIWCGCLTVPVIAPTGQPRAHLVQPIHFSGLME